MEKAKLLEHFRIFGKEMTDAFGQDVKETGEDITEFLRKKGLTYEEAYASLEYAYRKLSYESNFMRLQ